MTAPSRLGVLVADDHAVLRAGLRMLIDAQPDMQTVGEAANGTETLAQVAALHPDIVLLDLSMPHGGLELITALHGHTAHVLVLTMHTEDEYLRTALRLGADGYVTKAAADQELLSAIRAVARGEVYIHSAMTRALLADLSMSARPDRWHELSAREQQVIRQVTLGYTNREIAERLGLSTKTVETYRARAMDKLGLRTRAHLVIYAKSQGWVDEPAE